MTKLPEGKSRLDMVKDGVRSRVVSFPCWELFDRQDRAYRNEVLPPSITARVSIEEASTLGWDRWVGPEGYKGMVARQLLEFKKQQAERERKAPALADEGS